MDKNTKRLLLLITYGVALFVILSNLNSVIAAINGLIAIALPVIIGFIIAFVLSVPMNGFEKLLNKLFERCKRKPGEGVITAISFVLIALSVILVLALIVMLAVPALISSAESVITLVKDKWPECVEFLNRYHINTDSITQWISGLNLEGLAATIFGSAGDVLNSVLNISSTIISTFGTVGMGLVVAVYVLLDKKRLARQIKKLVYAYTKKNTADRLCHIAELIKQTYSKFLSGQCVEAVILGMMIFAAFTIAGQPYAGLIGVLAGFGTFIPYVGPIIACVVGAFLTLIASPSQALLCIILFLGVQFIEAQFIYPRVVGSSVGLTPLWTMIAAMMGGRIMGLLGMIFFIPFTAVIYALVREGTNERLKKKAAAAGKTDIQI